MSTRSNLAPLRMPLCAIPAGALFLILFPCDLLLADGETENKTFRGSRTPGDLMVNQAEIDPEYAKREVMRLDVQYGWAVDRVMDGQVDSEAMKHLVEAAKSRYEKAMTVFGADEWHTQSALKELRRCKKIDDMRPEKQRACWKARSDLKQACGLYLRQFPDGRFRADGSAAIADCILDAAGRIAAIRPGDPAAVQGYLAMVEVFCLRREYDSATEWADKARKAADEGDPLQLAAAHEFMGVILCAQKEYDRAAERFEDALLVLRRYYGGNNSSEYGMCLLNLAFIRVQQERFHEAEAYCTVARVILERHPGARSPFIGRTLTGRTARTCYEYCMAKVFAALEEYDEAEVSIDNYWRMSHPKDSNIPNPDGEVKELAQRIKRQKEADAEVARKADESAER